MFFWLLERVPLFFGGYETEDFDISVRWVAPTVGCKLNSDGCARGIWGLVGMEVWCGIWKGSSSLVIPTSLAP